MNRSHIYLVKRIRHISSRQPLRNSPRVLTTQRFPARGHPAPLAGSDPPLRMSKDLKRCTFNFVLYQPKLM
jgi:hypothetical protein